MSLKFVKREELPKAGDYLWRYMDIHKFIYFLKQKNVSNSLEWINSKIL